MAEEREEFTSGNLSDLFGLNMHDGDDSTQYEDANECLSGAEPRP